MYFDFLGEANPGGGCGWHCSLQEGKLTVAAREAGNKASELANKALPVTQVGAGAEEEGGNGIHGFVPSVGGNQKVLGVRSIVPAEASFDVVKGCVLFLEFGDGLRLFPPLGVARVGRAKDLINRCHEGTALVAYGVTGVVLAQAEEIVDEDIHVSNWATQ